MPISGKALAPRFSHRMSEGFAARVIRTSGFGLEVRVLGSGLGVEENWGGGWGLGLGLASCFRLGV